MMLLLWSESAFTTIQLRGIFRDARWFDYGFRMGKTIRSKGGPGVDFQHKQDKELDDELRDVVENGPSFHVDLDEVRELIDSPSEASSEIKTSGGTSKSSFRRELFDWAQALVTSIIFVGFLFIFVARVIGVDGPSMEPTLYSHEKILISNLFYTPKQGDVIVFTKKNLHLPLKNNGNREQPLVKRIIALEGQRVDIDFENNTVSVDGIVLSEPYIKAPTALQDDQTFPMVVPEGHVFVMGDNRNNSTDSRSLMVGTVDTRYILGKVLMRVYPFDVFGSVQ